MKEEREITSNYEKMKTSAADLFLRYDQEVMIRGFHLAHDADYLYVRLLSRDHRVNRSSGAVTWLSTCSGLAPGMVVTTTT